MKLASNIHYTDAYYISKPVKSLSTKLPHHEAFGFVKKGNGGSIVVSFVRECDVDSRDNHDPNHIVKGLIIPESALFSRQNNYLEQLRVLQTNKNVAVTWKDVLHVANMSRNDCSVMYTEGLLFDDCDDHIVLKDPETIRIYPGPIKNHPKTKPFYYVIPKSAVTHLEYIHD